MIFRGCDDMMKHKIICGKSEIELKQFNDNTFDSCVTDPPYELSFMNRKWDSSGISFKVELWKEVYRVLKPGSHILVAGIARTHHRMWVALEDAGFEIKDGIYHIFGSGFPKSLDISKSLDKMNGKERKVIGTSYIRNGKDGTNNETFKQAKRETTYITAPVLQEAIQWDGWGTALKPAVEIWCLACKPISECNIAANVLKWGVGGINVDGCRIPFQGDKDIGDRNRFMGLTPYPVDKGWNPNSLITQGYDVSKGRFPANLCLECCCEDDELGEGKINSGGGEKTIAEGITSINHPHRPFHYGDKKGNEKCLVHTNPNCVCRMLDEQSTNSKPTKPHLVKSNINNYEGWGSITQKKGEIINYQENTSGASRFFYQAKASQKERWFYCTICKQAHPMKERDKHIHNSPKKEKYKYLEFHPTQKPEKLIEYLIRLITPPNGTVLDPFLGSGTGLIAAEREGFNSIGIDSKREYCLISNQRLKNEIYQEQTKLTGKKSKVEREGF